MGDLLYIALTGLFLALTLGLVEICGRLMEGKQ